MNVQRRKEIERHLTEAELDERLAEAGREETIRRLAFVKNLYRGDTVEEAAERVGRSTTTGYRWLDRWNEGGPEELAPDFGGGRPPKVDGADRDRLVALLRADQPWSTAAIRDLLRSEFGVEYHRAYLSEFLRSLGLRYDDAADDGRWRFPEAE